MPKRAARKSKGSANRSHMGLAFFFMGFLLISTPYIVEHAGYTGEALVANGSLQGAFGKAIVFVDKHDIGGAVGVILNVPLSHDQTEQLAPFMRDSGIPVSYGGPFEFPEKLVVLTEEDPRTPGGHPRFDLSFWDDAVREVPDLLAKIRDSLQKGDQRYRVFAGYAAWSPFQLESEILVRERWDAISADHNVLFQNGEAVKWDALERDLRAMHEPRSNQS